MARMENRANYTSGGVVYVCEARQTLSRVNRTAPNNALSAVIEKHDRSGPRYSAGVGFLLAVCEETLNPFNPRILSQMYSNILSQMYSYAVHCDM